MSATKLERHVLKALVTGAGGFIGSHVVEACVRDGISVKAMVRYNSTGRWGWLESSVVKDDIEVVQSDIRDYDGVLAAMGGVDVVFHLAALIGIPYSYRSPVAYIKTNIEGTYNVLEAARQCEPEQVLVTSTSETYGTAQYVPIDEQHPAVGQSPYAASKVGADQLALSYHRSFSVPVKIVRPFNTYGPRQSARAIIPTVMSQLLTGRTRIDVGNLDPTRDLTYVEDTANAFLAIAGSPGCMGKPTNVGHGKEISIRELIRMISAVCRVECEVDVSPARVRGETTEVDRLCCDNSQLRTLTNWSPKVALEDGLHRTAEWMRSNLGGFKPGDYVV